MTITRQVQIDLAIYTAGVVRARREYRLHPFAHCGHAGQCVRFR